MNSVTLKTIVICWLYIFNICSKAYVQSVINAQPSVMDFSYDTMFDLKIVSHLKHITEA